MANVKITDLTALSGGDVASNDVLPIVDINNDQTKKIAISDLITATSASNDFITFTQLNANINVVQDNVEARHTQLNANLNVLDANADAIEARRVANVTVMTNEDTALQSRLATNVTAFTNEDTALQSRLATNVTAFTNEDTALQARIAANTLVAASNDFITFTRLNANINVVQDNVAGLTSTLTIRGDNASDDAVTLGSETLTFVGDTGLTTAVSSNTVTIDLDDTAVTAGLYGGVIGAVSNVPAITIDAQGRITNAANVEIAVDLSTLEGNVNTVSSNAAGVEARRVANIAGAISTVLTGDLTASRAMVTNGSGKIAVSDVTATELGHLDGVTSALQTQLDAKSTTSNATALALEDAGLQSRLSTNVTAFTNEDTALQARITANNTLTSAVETRRTQNIAGAISTVTTSDLTASRAMVTNGSGKIAVSDVTATELGHLDGVTSALQTQLDAKAALAGATFTGQVNMSDDLVVTGNLTVNGDTTTVSTVNLDVEDRMIMLADGVTGSPSADVGLLFNRGNQGNAAIFYDESATTFKLSDTKDPKSNTALSPVSAANLDLGILTAATVKQDGATLDNLISSNVDGAISTVNDTNLTASRALVSSSGGKIEVSAVTATEIGHLDGVSSAIQTQLNAKQATITGAATTIDDADLTASRALVSSGSGKVAVSDVTSTELGHLDGVTSAIQTQINGLETRRDANVTVAASNNAALESRRTSNIAGAVSTITTSDLTASRALVSSGSGKVAVSAVTATELGHLDGVSSAIQTQLNAKQATITGAATTIDDADLTASRALVSSGSGKVAVSDVTSTELGHLDGVTSAIQTQINALETRRDANVTVAASNNAALESRRTSNIAGAVSTITTSDLTASRAMVTNSSGKVAVSAVTATELGYLDGVTSAIQTQLNAKQATITGAATSIDDTNLTASRAVVSDSSGKVAVSAVTSTEIGYLDGVTSAIQTQFTGAETRRTNNIAGAVSTITTSDLTASRAMVTNGSGKVAVSAVTSTELGYLDGVTSAIQTQLNAKQATITGAATTIDDADLTASRALVSSGSGKVAVSDVTSTELGYLDGVTSAIQTQFTGAETRRTNNIAGAISTVTTSDLTASRALVSGSGGKIEVSAITATEIGHLDGIDQNINTNLAALAAGIAGTGGVDFPTGDYGLLDSANLATDAFGEATGALTTFDMKTTPSGSVATEDLGALS